MQPGSSLLLVAAVAIALIVPASPSLAEEIRFTIPPGAAEQLTVQGYDFVKVGGGATTLSIEPFGALCPTSSACPTGGSTYYLGVAPTAWEEGVSLYPTYPSAWAPYQVVSLSLATAPGQTAEVKIYGYEYPAGGSVPDYVEVVMVDDAFSAVTLQGEWTNLGELHIVTNGDPATPIFIDDIEATLVEPPPPDDAVPEENDCATFTFGPTVSDWPIVDLSSRRVATYRATACADSADPPYCDPSQQLGDSAIDVLGAFAWSGSGDVTGPDSSLEHASHVACGELHVQSETIHPSLTYYHEAWDLTFSRTFIGGSFYELSFDVVSPTVLAIDGALSANPVMGSQDDLWLQVRRIDDGVGTIVYDVYGAEAGGVVPVAARVALEPGEYSLWVRSFMRSGDAQQAVDLAFDFFEPGAPVPVAGGAAGGVVVISLAVAGLRRLRVGRR